MADSPVFEFVCGELERRTSLGRLEARGTVRLALKEAGLGASVSVREMQVVLERVLPGALASRGIENGEVICSEIRGGTTRLQDSARTADTPEAIFGRLGG
jgi:hypothetical protein